MPPIANFIYNPLNPTTADTIQFNDTSTDTDGTIVLWSWSFGDGSTSTLQNPTHQYGATGNYTVVLEVKDDDSATDTEQKIIRVFEAPPTLYNISGSIIYDGPKTGSVYVVLLDQFNQGSQPIDYIIMSSPGEYTFQVPNGTYYLGAWLDVNNDHNYTDLEPAGFAINRTVYMGPEPINVSGTNRMSVDITLYDWYNISGTIFYDGTETGTIYVLLFNQYPIEGMPPIASTTISSPGSYTFYAPNGTYYVGAFMDVNGNYAYDDGEPFGFAINKTLYEPFDEINISGNDVMNVNITLLCYGVRNLDTNKSYATIQAAIDDPDTLEGHTIFVHKGTYYENVVINKDGIRLIGEDKNTTVIDANDAGDGILISVPSHNMIISNFSVRNANGSGIIFMDYVQGTSVQNNRISNCIVYNSSTNEDDPDVADGFGIYLGGHDANIEDNVIINCEVYNNDMSGIIIVRSAYDQMKDNRIIDCKSYNNGFQSLYWDCAKAGIAITQHTNRYIENTIISGCEVYNNAGDGIFGGDFALGTKITNNTLYDNGWYGINVSGNVHSDFIYHNNLIDNSQNAYDGGTNTWYNTAIQEGNYWSDFDEPGEGAWDNDSNGIVDTPYNIPGGSNQDLYPLMYPWGRPNQPVCVQPINSSTGVTINPTLKVQVSDPNGDMMDVTFYDASNNNVIGAVTNVANNSMASVSWSGRAYSVTYSWYVIVSDGKYLTQSTTWSFTTQNAPPTPPPPSGPSGPSGPFGPIGDTNLHPKSDANGPYYGFIGNPVTFDGSSSSDSDGNITSYSWSFGDGTTGNGKITTHTYDKVGNYTVTLTVTDDEEETNTDTTYAVITEKPNYPPNVNFSYSPLNPTADDTIQFTDLSTDTDGIIVSYFWNFSDGTNSTDENPKHTYSKSGAYMITLKVTDDDNATDIFSKAILVEESNKDVTGTATEKPKGTPGFELIFVVCAIALVLFLKRRRIKV